MKTEIETLALGDRFRTCLTGRLGEVLTPYSGESVRVFLGASRNAALRPEQKSISGGIMVEFLESADSQVVAA